jgi:hypothetical protein
MLFVAAAPIEEEEGEVDRGVVAILLFGFFLKKNYFKVLILFYFRWPKTALRKRATCIYPIGWVSDRNKQLANPTKVGLFVLVKARFPLPSVRTRLR